MMFTLLKKEVFIFFSSLTGLVSSVIFFVILGLFLWFFPSEFNILDSGLASLEPIFLFLPWIFLFLIPAITMRMFSEEKKQGTLELLMTKPLREKDIVIAKFLAAMVIILVEMLAILFYFILVQFFLSDGAVDTGAFWGSFLGLILLAGVYISIGLFASSLTDNQIVSFLLAVIIILVLYLGFDLMSRIVFFKSISQIFVYLGLSSHYQSISKGVVDSRDIIYFFSVILVFLLFTINLLKKRN